MTMYRNEKAMRTSVSGKNSCTPKAAASSTASSRLKSRSQISSVASSDCAEVSSSSSLWRASSGSPTHARLATAYAIGSAPTSSVHWFTFEEISAPSPSAGGAANAKSSAITNSGDSEASGATHCTSRNSSML